MAQPQTIRFALLGTGLVAPFHARSIAAADGCELVAIADIDAERREKFAAEFGCDGRASLDELLADDSIDVINILTPNHLHSEATVAAAAAGKHVLVEKPPSMSLRHTDEMIAACEAAGVKLGVTLQCRIRKPIQAIRDAIAAGRFGKLLHGDAYMKWFRSTEYYLSDPWRSSRRSGAGVTIQHAFHYIDLLQYLMGPVKSVSAKMSNLAHPDVELEDTLLALVQYESGAQGVIEASTALWPGTDIRIEINGVDGTAIMVGERMETWTFRDDRPEDEEIRAFGSVAQGTAAGGPADFGFADHQVVIEGFAKAIRQDGQPLITAQSARDTLEIALAMYQSAGQGQPAELPVTDEESIWS